MKTDRILITLWLLLLALPMQAQQPDARTVLARTSEAFRKAGGVKVTFALAADDLRSAGTLHLRGEKFVLETEGVKTWFDGRTQWSYVASTNEVNISQPTPEELQTLNPYVWLTLYEQGYTLAMETAGGKNGTRDYGIVMTAADRKKELETVRLYVSKADYRLSRIELTTRGGRAKTVIDIRSYHAGQNYPDVFFTFNKRDYPTAEVIDLR